MIRLITLSLTLGLVGCSPSPIKHSSADLNPKTESVKIEDADQIIGNYSMIGRNPTDSNAGDYTGKVIIRKAEGDFIHVEQSIGLFEEMRGMGHITEEGKIWVVFSSFVEGTWTLLKDGSLKGTWNIKGQHGSPYDGLEVWAPTSS
jgi:hypothetical protein